MLAAACIDQAFKSPTCSQHNVLRAGGHVQGSPFQCQVTAGEGDASSSRLYGPGLQAIQLGKPSSLFLQLADQWGNTSAASDLVASGIKVYSCRCHCIACSCGFAFASQVVSKTHSPVPGVKQPVG